MFVLLKRLMCEHQSGKARQLNLSDICPLCTCVLLLLLNIICPAACAACQYYTNNALEEHLLTAGVREVKCGAEGQPLVTDFSQRKYWSRDGKQEPSQAKLQREKHEVSTL